MKTNFIKQITLAIIGVVLILIASIIMMCDFKNESDGVHVILGIILGLGSGVLISDIVFLLKKKSIKEKK
ncbi:MAG: hypothetical protein LBS76_02545 [Mycoplasmataceae bacterium]|nr:hypothetical protein [Mycoplasmataceae bacterium]